MDIEEPSFGDDDTIGTLSIQAIEGTSYGGTLKIRGILEGHNVWFFWIVEALSLF